MRRDRRYQHQQSGVGQKAPLEQQRQRQEPQPGVVRLRNHSYSTGPQLVCSPYSLWGIHSLILSQQHTCYVCDERIMETDLIAPGAAVLFFELYVMAVLRVSA